jgi:hypothetical protein
MFQEIKMSFMKYLNIILVLFVTSCNVWKIKLCSTDNKIETSSIIKKKIMHKIDSVYCEDSENERTFKKIVSSICLNDSILEVRTLTNYSTFDIFYFSKNLNLIEVVHELPDLH